MSCDPEQVTGYVDGELDPAATAALEAHLADCPACRDQAESERELGRRLREAPVSELPPGLEARVRMALPRRSAVPALRVLLPLAAALVLGVVLLRGSPGFVARAVVLDHTKCFHREPLPAKVWSGDPDLVASWFERQGTAMPSVPAGAVGLELVGARYCRLLDGSAAAHLYYAGAERRVSLFVIPHAVRAGRAFATQVNGRHVRILRAGGQMVGIVGERNQDVEAFREALATSFVTLGF